MSSIGSLHRLLELGRGGMARVWLAVSSGMNGFRKLVVVKQLRPEYAGDERVREMFLEEARLAAKLNHPNTVQTLEVTEHEGEYFIIMEYLDGQPLDAVQRHGPVPSPAFLTILADVCAGLHHAHELRDLDGTALGIVHRDVSPQNVFLTYSGQVKVVDFGIAKSLAGSNISQAGEIKGKANYMAPEQALGMSVDRRADIFSLGVMLYSALSGRRLWDGIPESKVIERLRLGDIPKLVPRPSGIHVPPPELMAICNKCISAAARDRYDTALEVQLALEDFAKKHGGLFSRGELGAFLGKAFEEQRTRRQSVIEEKVRALSEGTLLSSSVQRTPTAPPKSNPARSVGRLPPPPMPPRRSSGNRPAVRADGVAVSAANEEPERLSRVPTERPPEDGKVAPAPKGTWRMPEPYKLVSRLSSSALIFEARDMTTKRGVTVQLLKGALADEQLAQRYGAAGRLRHPNTVRLLDVGSVKTPVPVTYIVRENVAGTSLATRLRSGALDSVSTLRIGVGILESLAEAHAQGISHGRLTPSHVLLAEKESDDTTQVKVLGYWPSTMVVRKQEDEAYQDPTLGEAASTASDIYAVGQILHTCLTGTVHQVGAPVIWGETRLEAVLSRALEQEPNHRYQTAVAMLEGLRGVEWTNPDREAVLAKDRHIWGATPSTLERRLPVSKNELLSRRPVSVWVFDGDPTVGRSKIPEALVALGAQVEVRHLGEADRELAHEELVSGRVSPPWLVVFGPLHVVLGEPLLKVLRTTPETSRVLVSSDADFELLQRSVNDVGLDAQLFESADRNDVLSTLDSMVTRTRMITEGYDAVRLQLRRFRDELGQRSRELTATDHVH